MSADDPIFGKMSNAQALWYQTQIALDDKEQFETLIDIAEHNAMFSNPEGVQQVRDSRKNTYEVPDEDFGDMLEGAFGRKLPEIPENQREDLVEILKREQEREKSVGKYLDMELDEITFIPYNREA